MVNLILNENMKIYRRWRTWVLVGILIVIVCTGSLLEWYYDNKEAQTTDGVWQNQVTEEMLDQKKELSNPDIQEGLREYYENQVAIHEYRLAHNIRPESDTMWDGINGSSELIVLITLIIVIIAGDSLASEFSTGTIKLLLIRPASRLKILISKYISVIIFGILLVVLLFISSVLLNGLLYQFEHLNIPLVSINSEGVVSEHNMVANLWKTYLLNSVSTIMFVTMAFMISAAFRSSSMAIGFSIFALFAGFISLELVHRYAWSKYVLFANIDLTQHLSGRPFHDGMTMTFSVTVLAVYYIIFSLVAWLMFTKRDVAA